MDRRSYLKGVGTVTVGSLLAGCSGGDGGDGGGSTPTPDTTEQAEMTEVIIAMTPGKFAGIAMDQINNVNNTLENAMNEAGYTASVKKTFDGASLFASGQVDISSIGPIEATAMATERDFNLVHNAFTVPQWQGWYARTDTPYTVEAAGSQQAAIDKIVEDQATVAHGSWGGGHVLSDKYVHALEFDYTFAEEGGDFKVVTLDYSAVPKGVAEGQADVGVTFGTRGAPQLMNDEIANIYHHQGVIESNDLGTNINNAWTTRQSYAEEEPEAIQALVSAWQEGVDIVYEDPVGLATSKEEYQEALEVNNAEQAKWAAEWGMTDKHGYDHGMLYEDVTVRGELVDATEKFLNNGVDLDIVPEGWSDVVSFREVQP